MNRRWARMAACGLCLIALPAGCAIGQVPVAPADAGPGQVLFQSYCAACHQYDGQGVGAAPPLKASAWVTGPEERLIKIALNGVRGRMAVEGEIYDREMPGFGPILSDAEIASLLSFVRRRFGGPSKPIGTAAVAHIRAASVDRAGYWTVDELLGGP